MARHAKKEIENALKYAEDKGWRVIQSKHGHNWGYIACPHRERDGCRQPVYSTPLQETPNNMRNGSDVPWTIALMCEQTVNCEVGSLCDRSV